MGEPTVDVVVVAGDMHWSGYRPERQAETAAALDAWDADPPCDVTSDDLD
jgi:hypothetical protein